ncbi:MAG TPA: FxDxF family PEP-CTERM protein [Rhizorhapis sp.]
MKISYFLIGDAFMKNMLFSVGILAAAFTTSTQANAAAFIVFDGSTGMFGNTGIGSGPFSDTLNFEVPELGSVSSSITSVAISLLTDVSFSSVTLNGHEFNIDEIGATENRSFLNLPVTSGMQTLVINGTSGGSGSYSGTLAFAVPEPASWAMMIAGFGLLGGAIRVRKRQVKVSFAI